MPTAPENYDWSIFGEDPAREDGIFNFARADNPFADYSFIYVPSCTGDMHLGDVTRKYSSKLSVEHKGFVNGSAALDHLAEHYSHASQVVVVGKTVGSVAAPVYGGLVGDLLPRAAGAAACGDEARPSRLAAAPRIRSSGRADGL